MIEAEEISLFTVAVLCACAVIVWFGIRILARAVSDATVNYRLRRDYMRWRQQCRMADEWYVCCNDKTRTETEKEG
jgi:hypothetical protein